MKGEGRIFQRGAVFWVAYYVRGKEFREPGGKTEKEAAKRLKSRLGEKHGDRFIGPEQERVTVADLLDSLALDLGRRGAKALKSHLSHVKPVRQFFGLDRAVDVTTKRLEAFIASEETRPGKKKKSPASINRELAALRGAFNLARKQGQISRVPYFPMLREDNARQGFFEKEEFEKVAGALPAAVADVARFAYLSGWRKGEILPLTWENVDRGAGEVRIATSKNGHGRALPLTGALKDLIERRWQAREYLTREKVTAISPHVFHESGVPVGDFRKAWGSACVTAEVPGRLFHDLRRTAVRNMIRAGVPQTVAMSISGHRTVSMFNRYNITSNDDKREALIRTEAHLAAIPADGKVTSIGGHGQNADISASGNGRG
ncbi:MAG TPA: site-specific integrase [Thermoanaerobaculia bacterium]|jgi:integrase